MKGTALAPTIPLALLAAVVGCTGGGVSGLAPIYGYAEPREAPVLPIEEIEHREDEMQHRRQDGDDETADVHDGRDDQQAGPGRRHPEPRTPRVTSR